MNHVFEIMDNQMAVVQTPITYSYRACALRRFDAIQPGNDMRVRISSMHALP